MLVVGSVDSDEVDIVYSDKAGGVGGNWLKSTIPQLAKSRR